jgi:catechol 2,3-dioxygenase-like lactoylglutathione lyase family enzyme
LNDFVLHHVSVITINLDRSLEFYRDVLGLVPAHRPPFEIGGAWLACGASQLHLVDYPAGTYRGKNTIDNNDVHFALRVSNFDETLRLLNEKGFREDLPVGDPKRLLVKRTGLAGFPQVYLLDPDGHVVEINAAS